MPPLERKTDCKLPTFLGVTNGEWIGLAFIAVGFASSYAVMGENVMDNTRHIEENRAADLVMRRELIDQIRESEGRMQQQIRESEGRTRGDIYELRQILLNGNSRHQ